MLEARDFYEGITEETDELLKRIRPYVDLAIDMGDAIHLEKPKQLVIDIRLKKKEKK